MKRIVRLTSMVLALSLFTVIFNCSLDSTDVSVDAITSGSALHYIASDHSIGDVHPYYDSSTNKWFMYYLANISGQYVPKLLTSTDKMNWTQQANTHTGTSPYQPYYVLGIFNNSSTFYSYYGNGSTMQASQSTNLVDWQNGASSIQVPNDMTTFPASSRDPYVFFDPDANVYRCVSSAYRTNKEWGIGTTMDVSLAISSTSGNNLTSWGTTQTELKRFTNGYLGEPECPQMIKIGNRWYLFASMARRALNNGNVGPMSYWIGDANTALTSVNWASKTEYILDGQDLCAPQIAYDGTKYLLWGWIPSSSSNAWGGNISLTREVQQQTDGTLTLKLDSNVGTAIRGEQIATITPQTIPNNTTKTFSGTYNRADVAFTVTNNYTTRIQIGNTYIDLIKSTNQIKIYNGSTTIYATSTTPANGLSGTLNIRVVAEGDIVEVFVNDKYSCAAKSAYSMSGAQIKIKAVGGSLPVSSAITYRLKWLEEVGATISANDEFRADTTNVTAWGLQNNNYFTFKYRDRPLGVYVNMPWQVSYPKFIQSSYCWIDKVGYINAHADTNYDPIFSFKCPSGGNVSITVSVKRGSPANGSEQTLFKTFKNTTQIYPGSGSIYLTDTMQTFTFSTDVNKNTTLSFDFDGQGTSSNASIWFDELKVKYNSVNANVE